MNFSLTRTRSISYVPKWLWAILIFSIITQSIWHFYFSSLEISHQHLTSPPKASTIKLASLDDNITAAKMLMLWLQAFDNQPGLSIPLKELEYDRVIEWLDLILELDNKIEYPLLAAIRFYAEVVDKDRQRKMVHYVKEKFLEKPNERWQFMAHAVYIAQYRIKDIALAQHCANLIRQYATADNVPYWAKQMEIFILEKMGELESAKIIIGGLLESGELEDPNQVEFLTKRLQEIEDKSNDSDQ